MDLIGWLFVVVMFAVTVYQISARNQARTNFLTSVNESQFTSYQDFIDADLESIVWTGNYRGEWTLRDSRYSYAKLHLKFGDLIGAETSEGAITSEKSGLLSSHTIIINARTNSVIADLYKVFGQLRYTINLPSGVKYSFIKGQIFNEDDSRVLSIETSGDWQERSPINVRQSLEVHKSLLSLLIIGKYLCERESLEAD